MYTEPFDYTLVFSDYETKLMECENVTPEAIAIGLQIEGEDDIINECSEDWQITNETIYNSEESYMPVFHNIGYDLGAAARNFPHLIPEIYKKIDQGTFQCTMLREQLL